MLFLLSGEIKSGLYRRGLCPEKKGLFTMKKLKTIPKFKNEHEESVFWLTHDSADYINWKKSGRAIFPELKPTSRAVPIRFSISLLERLKYLANRKHIHYQSLAKLFLEQSVEREFKHI
jgi:predicted DNA binding CopG/RHH family protein